MSRLSWLLLVVIVTVCLSSISDAQYGGADDVISRTRLLARRSGLADMNTSSLMELERKLKASITRRELKLEEMEDMERLSRGSEKDSGISAEEWKKHRRSLLEVEKKSEPEVKKGVQQMNELELLDRIARAEPEQLRKMERRQTAEECIQGDIVFVVDSSGSILMENWIKVLDFMSSIVSGMDIGPLATQVGLITYGNRAHIIFGLSNHTSSQDVVQAIKKAPFLNENTNTSGAIRTARSVLFNQANGDRPKAPNLCIVITDGVSTYDHDKTIPYAQEARAAGITIISIGVGDKISLDELKGISSKTERGEPLVFQVGNYSALAQIKSQLARVSCDIPVEGTTQVAPTVCVPDIAVNPTPGTCVHRQGDVVFVLDSSGSIGIDRWNLVLQFVKEAIKRLGVGSYGTHVGLLTFSNKAHVIFDLNTYTNINEIQQAVLRAPFLNQNTNTSGGIYVARSQMFSSAQGDRVRAPNTCIVITDGGSTYDNDKTIPYAEEARRAGITMIAIGVADQVNVPELQGIASLGANGKPLVFQVGGYEFLNTIMDGLMTVYCNLPVDCTGKANMVLRMDTSGSNKKQTGDKLDKMKQFVKMVIKTLIDNVLQYF